MTEKLFFYRLPHVTSARDLRDALTRARDASVVGIYFGPATTGLYPLHQAAFAAQIAPEVLLLAAVEPVFTEPYHVAQQALTLDHASRGKAGLHIVPAPPEAAAEVGRPEPTAAEIDNEVADAIEVYQRLFDSWEDDAVIRDVETGRFLDKDKIHNIEFSGATYSVYGASFTPRGPQGQIPILGHDHTEIEIADDIDAATSAGEATRPATFREALGLGHAPSRYARN